MNTNDVIWNVVSSKDKVRIDCPMPGVREAVDLGFSYMESTDHMVHYVITNGRMMKKILTEVGDTVLNPEYDCIGSLWTALLLVSNKLKDHEIIFSNSTFSTVLNVNPNPKDQFYD